MQMIIDFIFPLVLLGIACYVLYSAITGKGKLFATDNIKEDKVADFKKWLRLIYAGLGVVMLILALLSAYQKVLFCDVECKLSDTFKTDFADSITADGTVADSSLQVDTVYAYSDLYTQVSALGKSIQSQHVDFPRGDDGDYVYLGIGETPSARNETFTKLRNVFSNRVSNILTWVFMGLALLIVAGVFIRTNRFTDKEKLEKAKQQSRSGGSTLPSSAFDFEEKESEDAK